MHSTGNPPQLSSFQTFSNLKNWFFFVFFLASAEANSADCGDWDPDGYVESDSEDHGSESDEYSAERSDHFDDESPFNLAFFSKDRPSSMRMRSFRSYDSLNLMDPLSASGSFEEESGDHQETAQEEDADVDSGAGSDPLADRSSPEEEASRDVHRFRAEERFDSGISSDPSADRSSPEEEESSASAKDSAGRTGILRRSAEALSEDSGYGDASGSFPPVLHCRTLIHFKVNPF